MEGQVLSVLYWFSQMIQVVGGCYTLVTCLAVGVVRGSVQHQGTPLCQRVFIASTFTRVRIERTTVEAR